MKDKRKRYRFRHGFVTPTPLWRHQAIGVKALVRHEHQGIGDVPGLGKTLQALYAASDLLCGKRIDKVVVACGARHAGPWLRIVREHAPRLKVQCMIGRTKDKRRLNPRADVYIYSYEVLRRTPPRKGKGAMKARASCFKLRSRLGIGWVYTNPDVQRVAHLLINKRVLLIADEAHAFKTPTSQTCRVMLALGALASRRAALTGTPAAERPWDVWAPTYFIDYGRTLGRSYSAFLSQFAVMRKVGPYDTRKPVRGKNLDVLHAKLKRVWLRRLKEDCDDLPPKNYMWSDALTEGRQRALLLRLERSLIAPLVEYIRDEGEDAPLPLRSDGKRESVSAVMHALSRAAACPSLLDPKCARSAKLDAVLDRLDELGEREQVVLFAWHVDVVDRLVRDLRAHGVAARPLHGQLGFEPKKRDARIDAFMRGKFRVLVATADYLRESVTLTCAQHVIFVERGYALLNWTQAQDRVHRYGQTGTVVIEVLEADLGLDRHVTQTLTLKERDVEATQDGAEPGEIATAGSLLASLRARHRKYIERMEGHYGN